MCRCKPVRSTGYCDYGAGATETATAGLGTAAAGQLLQDRPQAELLLA
jgi:hypothetical protein